MFRFNPRPDPQRTDALAAAGGPAGRAGLLRGDAHPQGRGHRGLLRRTDHHRNTRKGEIILMGFKRCRQVIDNWISGLGSLPDTRHPIGRILFFFSSGSDAQENRDANPT